MGEINPDDAIDDQAGEVIILAAVRASDKHVYPLKMTDSGDVSVDIDLPDAVDPSTSLTLSGSRQQLATKVLKAGLILKADKDNTDDVWIGGPAVAVDDGLPLEPGESFPFSIENANLMYYIGTASDILHVIGG